MAQTTNNPSPQEITAACLAIQSEWSAVERMKRLRVDLRPAIQTADGRLVDVSTEAYEAHQAACEAG